MGSITNKGMTMKVISTRVYNQNQSWVFEKVVETYDQKVKVTIVRNAYDMQSYGKTEIWADNKWNKITNVPIQFLECKKISYVQENVGVNDFEKDYKFLLEEALQII